MCPTRRAEGKVNQSLEQTLTRDSQAARTNCPQELLGLAWIPRLMAPIARLLRDLSPLHRNRVKLRQLVVPTPRFGISLSIKSYFGSSSLGVVISSFLVCLVISSYMIYICERKNEESIAEGWDDFVEVLWFTAVTMTTVGFGDMIPKTAAGRALACVQCILGIFFMGFLCAILYTAIELSPKARHTKRMLQLIEAKQQQQTIAANMIQIQWRRKANADKGSSRRHNAALTRLSHAAKQKRREVYLLNLNMGSGNEDCIRSGNEDRFEKLECGLKSLQDQIMKMSQVVETIAGKLDCS